MRRNTGLRVSLGVMAALLATAAPAPLLAQDEAVVVLDEISVTATRVERATRKVPSAITVVGKDTIESSKMFNVKDALQGTPGVLIDSKNAGFDARLVIRGAGTKAAYGVREIMVLRDGVPMTDPDSFTRLDFIDTQDIERIEVTKGPGSIYGGGSSGGVIQILSRSVFDMEDRVRIGGGNNRTANLHGRVSRTFDEENQAVALSATHRQTDNGWRRWNEFETNQISFKHGLESSRGGVLESEVSYSKSEIQLPGTMDDEQFAAYKSSGKQTDNKDPWKHSGRYADSFFASTKYEHELEDVTLRTKLYANFWKHYHPVTAAINVSNNNYIFGGDVETSWDHSLLGDATLLGGISLRRDITRDAEKYEYADVVTGGSKWFGAPAEILETLSDRTGTLIKSQDVSNKLYGVFLQETLEPNDRLLIDIGVRYDWSKFEIETDEYREYNWGAGC